ncbi:MAG: hypothetical protein GY722_13665 [bacterium]|nr:hypothetical protein [bacterium]
MSALPLSKLPHDWESTRSTLHAYANAVGVVARAHAISHPKWWHISLTVVPTGLVSDPMPVPGGGRFWIRVDFVRHVAVVEQSDGSSHPISMADGLTATEFGDALIETVTRMGLEADYVKEKYASDEPRLYDAGHAAAFFAAVTSIEHNLQIHRSEIGASVGPIQVWPHGFDIAFEWFGAGGSQLNLGFYPAGRPYFYSNPWPFSDEMKIYPLPAPAIWHEGDWEGSILYYDELLETDDPSGRLLEYAKAVFDIAVPILSEEAAD